MTTRVGVGTSTSTTAVGAATEAVGAAVRELDGGPDQLIVFATTGYDQLQLIEAVGRLHPDVPLVGCSAEGIIDRQSCRESLHVAGVMALRSDTMRFACGLFPGYAEDSVDAGRRLATWVREVGRGEERLLVVFPDGLRGSCQGLLDELGARLPGLPIVGGAANDAMLFEHCYQYHGQRVSEGAVSAWLICGDVQPELAVSHGCRPIGLPRTITHGGDGWVHTIDGRAAWEVFTEYLDDEPLELTVEHLSLLCLGEPLSDAAAAEYGSYVANTPVRLEASTGSLFFPSGRLAEGQVVQLLVRNHAEIERSARACSERITRRRPGQDPILVLQIDCAGRGRLMFGDTVHRRVVAPMQRFFSSSVPWLGMYSVGEIAPIGGRTYHHNYTVVLCAVYEGRPQEVP